MNHPPEPRKNDQETRSISESILSPYRPTTAPDRLINAILNDFFVPNWKLVDRLLINEQIADIVAYFVRREFRPRAGLIIDNDSALLDLPRRVGLIELHKLEPWVFVNVDLFNSLEECLKQCWLIPSKFVYVYREKFNSFYEIRHFRAYEQTDRLRPTLDEIKAYIKESQATFRVWT